jgi:hypothetical protein
MNKHIQNTIVIFFLLCSITYCKSANTFENVKLEFEQQDVSLGILNKLSEFFEYSDAGETEIPQYLEDEDDEDEDEKKATSDIVEGIQVYEESGEELSKYIGENSNKKENTPENQIEMSKGYKNIVYKLCLFSAISKETTIYVTESKRV